VNVLHEQVSIQSLAAFRMAFGLLMAFDVWRFFRADRIYRYYVQPEFLFSYHGFGWILPLPEPYIYYAWALVGVLALMVAAGFFYRFAIIAFTLLFSYFFLLDKAQYLNHFYMALLYSGLLCLLPANRAYSVDAKLFPRLRSKTVPRWSIWALRTQTEIILLYAGLVKITEDWLKSEPLGMWLRARAVDFPFGELFYNDSLVALGAWGTIALHLFGAPLLLFKRTRLPIFLVYCVFHVANSMFFNIGIFPWLAIGASTMFLAPNWPTQLEHWLGRFERLPEPAKKAGSLAVMPRSRGSAALIGVLGLWMALQALIPLRSALYPSEVRWAGEGHRFSWRMRMYHREARGTLEVVDARGGARWRADPAQFLTMRQARTMSTRPDMILQFAHYLEREWARRGYPEVRVYADVEMSLNGRPYQTLIRPDVDLAREEWSPFRSSADFVTDLTTPFRPWREREPTSGLGEEPGG